MNTIEIKLSIDEINLILEALGQMPFVRVYELIGQLQAQAQASVSGQAATESQLQDGPG